MTDKEKTTPIKEPPLPDDDGADRTIRVDEDNKMIEPPVAQGKSDKAKSKSHDVASNVKDAAHQAKKELQRETDKTEREWERKN